MQDVRYRSAITGQLVSREYAEANTATTVAEAYTVIDDEMIEHYCEIMHDAYEAAALDEGWDTQESSRKPWADVPEANKATMRAAVRALVKEIDK